MEILVLLILICCTAGISGETGQARIIPQQNSQNQKKNTLEEQTTNLNDKNIPNRLTYDVVHYADQSSKYTGQLGPVSATAPSQTSQLNYPKTENIVQYTVPPYRSNYPILRQQQVHYQFPLPIKVENPRYIPIQYEFTPQPGSGQYAVALEPPVPIGRNQFIYGTHMHYPLRSGSYQIGNTPNQPIPNQISHASTPHVAYISQGSSNKYSSVPSSTYLALSHQDSGYHHPSYGYSIQPPLQMATTKQLTPSMLMSSGYKHISSPIIRYQSDVIPSNFNSYSRHMPLPGLINSGKATGGQSEQLYATASPVFQNIRNSYITPENIQSYRQFYESNPTKIGPIMTSKYS